MPTLVVSPEDVSPSRASRDVAAGRARRIARGVITYDLVTPLPTLVRAHVWEIVARLLPGAVVTDRTAAAGGVVLTGEDGNDYVFVAHPRRRRDLELPGLLVSVRSGPGPMSDDQRFLHDGLHLASPARMLVDNARLSHGRHGRLPRTLNRRELEDKVAELAATLGPQRLSALRHEVERVADRLGEHALGAMASMLIGVAQATVQDARIASPLLAARRDGVPIDRQRLEMLDVLADHLRARSPSPMVTTPSGESRRAALPFYEAYFSNFIEGTEFDIAEAADIVYRGRIPPGRPADAHDILGTYAVIASEEGRSRTPASGDELLTLLRDRHASVLRGRPDMNPGTFKTVHNRVGSHIFVAPDAVVGTLQAGYERLRVLDDAFARAVTMMFLVAEVHPFDDGNGRVARLMMNAELTVAAQQRIVIPTVFRDNYLAALRAMSLGGRPSALVATLDFAQRWTAHIDWSTTESARADLVRTNALLSSQAAESEGLRLQLPSG